MAVRFADIKHLGDGLHDCGEVATLAAPESRVSNELRVARPRLVVGEIGRNALDNADTERPNKGGWIWGGLCRPRGALFEKGQFRGVAAFVFEFFEALLDLLVK